MINAIEEKRIGSPGSKFGIGNLGLFVILECHGLHQRDGILALWL